MKMAKASEADLEAAMQICGVIESVERGLMPEAIANNDGEMFSQFYDSHHVRVLEHILDIASKGSIGRVVFGMAVILDPRNEAIDPDADTIEHHPKRLETDRVRMQRDELLAALKECRFALEPYDDIKPRDWKTDRANLMLAHQSACAVIAKVEG